MERARLKIAFPFTEMATFDPSIANAMFNAIKPEHWNEHLFRQQIFPPHVDTFAIHLRNRTDPDSLLADGNPDSSDLVDFPLLEYYAPFFNPIMDIIKTKYKVLEYGAMMVNLPAGKNVGVHRDRGNLREYCSRLHIPLSTNPKVIMSCRDWDVHMPVGSVYEINNTRWAHGVVNEGDTDRVHLIVDVFGHML